MCYCQAEERERSLATEHLHLAEDARRARAKTLEDMFNRKRDEVTLNVEGGQYDHLSSTMSGPLTSTDRSSELGNRSS